MLKKKSKTLERPHNWLEVYKNHMKEIHLMEEYIQDVPEIFNFDSLKCKQFLIHMLKHLNSDFHYLSFLNDKEAEQELLKVTQILQIHPPINQQNSKSFSSMDNLEQHKFWMRFFSRFKLKSEEISSEISAKEKVNIFQNVSSALNYLNYEFPIINHGVLKKVDVNAEIDSWNQLAMPENITKNEISSNSNSDLFQTEKVNVEKLLSDVEYVTVKFDSLKSIRIEKMDNHEDFFSSFKDFGKDIMKYASDAHQIESFWKKDLFTSIIKDNDDLHIPNLDQVKRCNDLFAKIISKKGYIENNK